MHKCINSIHYTIWYTLYIATHNALLHEILEQLSMANNAILKTWLHSVGAIKLPSISAIIPLTCSKMFSTLLLSLQEAIEPPERQRRLVLMKLCVEK